MILREYPHLPDPDEHGLISLCAVIEDWLQLPEGIDFLEKTPLGTLSPRYWQQAIDHGHRVKGIQASYTRPFRDREQILIGSVQQGFGRNIRAAMDFNAPAGSGVVSHEDAKVICVDVRDPGLVMCGRRVALEMGNTIFVYLNLEDVTCLPGDFLQAGEVFGKVAGFETNGGQHTHVGLMMTTGEKFKEEIWQTSPLLTGYCEIKEVGPGAFFLNPLPHVLARRKRSEAPAVVA